MFFKSLNLNCFHRTGLGLSDSLPRNLCVQAQPRLPPYPVARTTQAAIWSTALAHRELSLLCNDLFPSWIFSLTQCFREIWGISLDQQFLHCL